MVVLPPRPSHPVARYYYNYHTGVTQWERPAANDFDAETVGADALCAAASAGDLPSLLWQLWQVGVPVNAAGSNGFVALHAAVLGGHEAIVELLLQNGADADMVRAHHPSLEDSSVLPCHPRPRALHMLTSYSQTSYSQHTHSNLLPARLLTGRAPLCPHLPQVDSEGASALVAAAKQNAPSVASGLLKRACLDDKVAALDVAVSTQNAPLEEALRAVRARSPSNTEARRLSPHVGLSAPEWRSSPKVPSSPTGDRPPRAQHHWRRPCQRARILH